MEIKRGGAMSFSSRISKRDETPSPGEGCGRPGSDGDGFSQLVLTKKIPSIANGTSVHLLSLCALFLMIGLLCACGNHDFSPKPRGYFRIKFPEKAYQEYSGGCPFIFKYPTYAVIEPDLKKGAEPCWLNMQFPQFKGTLHLSYEHIQSKKMFDMLTEDAYKLAAKHTVKATSIDQGYISSPFYKVYGVYYTIDGNVGSSAQFFLTDSAKNYIRGALYFNVEPRMDSIAPVLDFVKKDVNVMIKSFRWK